MRIFAAGGPDAVRVEALAKDLGVSKGGFYWHFDGRQALIEETLDSWEKTGTEDVIATVDSGPADPRAKLRRLFELAPAAMGLFAVELALRDFARRDRDVARRLRRVDRRRMGYLRSLFVGSYFVTAAPGKRRRAEIMQLAVDRLLDERWD